MCFRQIYIKDVLIISFYTLVHFYKRFVPSRQSGIFEMRHCMRVWRGIALLPWEKRVDMDLIYGLYRQSPSRHLAWLADMTRSLLRSRTMRKVVDVVHFERKEDVK